MPLKSAPIQRDDIPGMPLPDPDLTRQGIVEAMYNGGRWIVRCPDDPQGRHFVEVKKDQQDFICTGCYPDLRAAAFKRRDDDLFIPVPDDALRQAATDQAIADGRQYIILFPDNVTEIEDVLLQRPTEAMNWLPGETMDFLLEENAEHGVSANLPDVTVSGGE